MYRIAILYEHAPDPDGYADHVARFTETPNGVFRHGRVIGAPMGEAKHEYYAEWEFADKGAFEEFVGSEQFMASGRDVMERGWPMPTVEFVELS